MTNVRMLAVVVAFATLLIGCPPTSRRIRGPSGGLGYAVECGSAVTNQCFEEAGDDCPHGYDVIREDYTEPRHQLIVECK